MLDVLSRRSRVPYRACRRRRSVSGCRPITGRRHGLGDRVQPTPAPRLRHAALHLPRRRADAAVRRSVRPPAGRRQAALPHADMCRLRRRRRAGRPRHLRPVRPLQPAQVGRPWLTFLLLYFDNT